MPPIGASALWRYCYVDVELCGCGVHDGLLGSSGGGLAAPTSVWLSGGLWCRGLSTGVAALIPMVVLGLGTVAFVCGFYTSALRLFHYDDSALLQFYSLPLPWWSVGRRWVSS
ncbi:hypothetical protein L484_001688 [Morus notabilis]|uniref:Uncharacterized protein n=1 Tax=Morus notabilis TaxID=981085 RepID=W9SEF2_9ROSA|nr:hypothetical protein L484_001688 [Morus notabilis]